MARDYDRERSLESASRKKGRADRNKARRIYFNHLAERYGEAQAKKMMKGKHVDHIKPIAQGGATVLSNLRLRSPEDNVSDKGTIFKGRKTTRPKNP